MSGAACPGHLTTISLWVPWAEPTKRSMKTSCRCEFVIRTGQQDGKVGCQVHTHVSCVKVRNGLGLVSGCLWFYSTLSCQCRMKHFWVSSHFRYHWELRLRLPVAAGEHFYTLKCPLWDIYSKLAFSCPFTITALLERAYKQKKSL